MGAHKPCSPVSLEACFIQVKFTVRHLKDVWSFLQLQTRYFLFQNVVHIDIPYTKKYDLLSSFREEHISICVLCSQSAHDSAHDTLKSFNEL